MKIKTRIVTRQREAQRASEQTKNKKRESSSAAVAKEAGRLTREEGKTVHLETAKEINQESIARADKVAKLKALHQQGKLKYNSREVAASIDQHLGEEIVFSKLFANE